MGNYLINREFRRATITVSDLDNYQGTRRIGQRMRAAIRVYLAEGLSLEKTAERCKVDPERLSDAVQEVKANAWSRAFEKRDAERLAAVAQREKLDAELLAFFE